MQLKKHHFFFTIPLFRLDDFVVGCYATATLAEKPIKKVAESRK